MLVKKFLMPPSKPFSSLERLCQAVASWAPNVKPCSNTRPDCRPSPKLALSIRLRPFQISRLIGQGSACWTCVLTQGLGARPHSRLAQKPQQLPHLSEMLCMAQRQAVGCPGEEQLHCCKHMLDASPAVQDLIGHPSLNTWPTVQSQKALKPACTRSGQTAATLLL